MWREVSMGESGEVAKGREEEEMRVRKGMGQHTCRPF